ncbi:MAG: hypothetical protein AAGI46_12920 [Planctomycetota bacterium]
MTVYTNECRDEDSACPAGWPSSPGFVSLDETCKETVINDDDALNIRGIHEGVFQSLHCWQALGRDDAGFECVRVAEDLTEQFPNEKAMDEASLMIMGLHCIANQAKLEADHKAHEQSASARSPDRYHLTCPF